MQTPIRSTVFAALLALGIATNASAGLSLLSGASFGRVDGSDTVVGSNSAGWSINGVQVRPEAPAWMWQYYSWYGDLDSLFASPATASLTDFTDSGVFLAVDNAENYRIELHYQFTVNETTAAYIRAWHTSPLISPPTSGYWNVRFKPVDEPVVPYPLVDDQFHTDGYSMVDRSMLLAAGKTYELHVTVERDGAEGPWFGFGRPNFRFLLAIDTGVPGPGPLSLIFVAGFARGSRRRPGL